MTRKIIPFGEVIIERLNICIKHGLLENVSGFWKPTEKGKIYEWGSLRKYLVGEIEKPNRVRRIKKIGNEVNRVVSSRDVVLEALLSM